MRLASRITLFCWQRSRIIYILLLSFLITGPLSAQDVKVRGGFLSDSLKIGEETAFYLSATYPSDREVLFPDSTFKFTPFEFNRKQYFATSTSDGVSHDSTLYFLSTFEIDSVQTLRLPVYLLQQGDCTVYFSDTDEIFLQELVASVPDSISAEKLPLIADTRYQNVKFDFNIFVFSIIAAIVLVAGVLFWIFFGKKIVRYFKIRKLEKRHLAFISAHNAILEKLRERFSVPTTESALSLWKSYLEQLEGRPYTKLTTRDIIALYKDRTLEQNLRSIDRAIYGHENSVRDSLLFLQQEANKHYENKLKEVKHGK